MKIAHFDPFSGIAGDMAVGAFIDAGADAQAVCAALESLKLNASFTVEKTKRKGMAATKFSVFGGEQKAHRHLPHIVKIIEGGDLPDVAKQRSIKVFETLGQAEAKSHDVPMEKVHFHEVGAVDSICDIVGACTAATFLGIERFTSSRINVGGGTVKADHGVMPVPAPATARLLEGKPVYSSGPQVELTTPTGAALLSALCDSFGVMPAMTVESSGYGAGDHDFQVQANLLRLLIGQGNGAPESTQIFVLEANIDDATPQVLAFASERLMEKGALDVTMTPIQMKKGRPGVTLQVITSPELREQLSEIIFAETTTLGLRFYQAERRILARKFIEIETSAGNLKVKVAGNTFAPEYEDAKVLAQTSGRPLREILSEAASKFWAK
jgi:pyridinium-3,5-bisthiocarboxylic acid mononucleotide nickel chelatase